METLSPEGWLTRVQGKGYFLWEPYPAVTETDFELIMDAKINRMYASHVMIVLWFMIYLWRKQIRK